MPAMRVGEFDGGHALTLGLSLGERGECRGRGWFEAA
jgi:hypothetical protein